MRRMTAQQEAYQLISKMPDESVRHLVELLKSMAPNIVSMQNSEAKPHRLYQRLGAGKGIITDVPAFDKWDDEVAALFEGETQ